MPSMKFLCAGQTENPGKQRNVQARNSIEFALQQQNKKKLFVLKIRFITYKSGKCIYIDILYVCIYIQVCKTIAKAPLTLTTATLKNNLSRFTY